MTPDTPPLGRSEKRWALVRVIDGERTLVGGITLTFPTRKKAAAMAMGMLPGITPVRVWVSVVEIQK